MSLQMISCINKSKKENKLLSLQSSLSSEKGILLWLATLFLAGFTPLPYKVFTIASGNSFYSALYAELYEYLLKKYDFIRTTFNKHFVVFGTLTILSL